MAEITYRKVVDFSRASAEINMLASKISTWSRGLQHDLTDEVIHGVQAIRRRAIQGMQNTKRASHFYMRGGKRHFPSAPLNYPAIDSGRLIGSLLVDARPLEVHFGTPLKYGLYLDEGTKRMKPRPWLAESVDPEIPTIQQNLVRRLQDEFK